MKIVYVYEIFAHLGTNFILHSPPNVFQQRVRLLGAGMFTAFGLYLCVARVRSVHTWRRKEIPHSEQQPPLLSQPNCCYFHMGRAYFAAHFLLLQAGRSRIHPGVGCRAPCLINSPCATSPYSCLWSFIYRPRGIRRLLAARVCTLSPRAPQGA